MVAATPPPQHRPPPQIRSIHVGAGGVGAVALGGGGGGGFDPGYVIPASFMNSFRVTSVAERLAKLVRTGPRFDHRQFFNLCVTLSRGIDYAVANNEIPAKAQDLPQLFRQIYQHKNEMLLQAAIMMVMISVKSACKSGWFMAHDADMLLSRANELGMSFCNPADVVTQPENPSAVVSKILDRFYPWLKMTHIFTCLEVKPGFGAYLLDFHVMKNKAAAREKIRLFVAQTDNIDSSSCLVTPQRANFLLNGKGIERRINHSMDNGPQFPTNVTTMVKFGTNLLQAVGHFNGNYAIIVAFTSEVSSVGLPNLQHYARPLASEHDLDSEIIEGASRISLNCPISFRRLITPVKGQLCKHHQCFDYANYIKINSRRPSWRCPHCNQSVSYTDLRVDQRMVEVLKEVGDNVADVIISADGSWKPVRESGDSANKQDKTLGNERVESDQCAPGRFSASAANVVDLTMDEIEEKNVMERNEDVKPLQGSAHANTEMEFDISGVQNEDSFWSGIQFSNYAASNEPVTPNTRFDSPVVNRMSELIPVLTDAVTPAHSRDSGDMCWTSQPPNSLMSSFTVPDNLLIQQSRSSEYGDLTAYGEAGRQRIIARTPVAVQALPAQHPVPDSRQRARHGFDYPMSNGAEYGGATETQQQQSSRSNTDSSFTSDMLNQPYPRFQQTPQNWGPRPVQHSQPPVQQIVGLPAPSRVPGVSGSYRNNNVRPSPNQPSPVLQHSQPSPGTRVSQMASQPTMARPPPHLSHTPGRQREPHSNLASQPGGQHSRMISQQPTQAARSLPVEPVQLQPRRGSPSLMVGDGHRSLIGEQRGGNVEAGNPTFPRFNNSSETTPEQSWRPAGRMRGSLSGRAFSDALSQNIILPSAIRDPPVNTSSTPSANGGSSQRPSMMPPPVNTISPSVSGGSSQRHSGLLPPVSLISIPSSSGGSSQRPLGMPQPLNPVSTPSASGGSSQRPSMMPPPANPVSTPSASGGSSQRPLGMPPPVNAVSTPSDSGGSSQRPWGMPPPTNTISTPSTSGGSSQSPSAMPPPVNPIRTTNGSGGSSQRPSVVSQPINTISTHSNSDGSSQSPPGMPPPVNPISTPSAGGGSSQSPSASPSVMPPPMNTTPTPSTSGGSSQSPSAMSPPVNPISTPSPDGSSLPMPPPVNTISAASTDDQLPINTASNPNSDTPTMADQTMQLDVDEMH